MSFTYIPRPAPADEVCDFCTAPNITTVFVCTPGTHAVLYLPGQDFYVDDGEWAACVPCAELVRAGLRGALVRRAWTVIDAHDAAHRASVSEMQAIFWRTRTGTEHPAAPIDA